MKKKTLNRLFKVLLVSGDSVFSLAALVFAYYFRFYAEVVPVKHGIPEVKYYLMAAPVVIIVFLLAFNYTGLYRNDRKHSGYSEIAGVFISVTAGTVILLAGTFFIREFTYSRGAILLMWGATVVFVGAWRLLYRAFYIYLSRKEMIINRILVAGATEMSGMLIERLKRSPGMGYRIVGCLDNKIKKGEKFRGVKVLGGIKELRRVLNEKKVDEVFVGAADYNRKEIADTILENENVSFMIVSDVLGIITKSIDYDSFFGIPVFAVKELPLNKMRNRFMKRAFDIAASSAGLVLFFPVMAAAAAVIKISSPGPVFYKQERVGRNNKVFKMYKFRTMKADAEKSSGPVWADKGDERRTRAGSFLRKTSLDEIPQLINVFKGEMSLAGPRPERPFFVDKFRKSIPRYMERHKVKAGITGWAQVNGLRGNTSLEERVKYDLYYIENWSMFLEFKIIIRTILEVFHHTTAY